MTLIVKLNERVEKDAAENPLIVGMITVTSSLLKRIRENLLQKYLSNMKNPETWATRKSWVYMKIDKSFEN